MSIPATIYVALGATTAAVIAGWVSTTAIIVAKDQKISEFRQKWIDDLRESTASLIGSITMLSGAIHFHADVEPGLTEKERIKAFGQEISRYAPEILPRISKIRLMLHPRENVEVIEKLNKLAVKLEGVAENFRDTKAIESVLQDFEGSIQLLLKKEWERVKSGEPNYQTYKRNSELFPIILFVLVLISVCIAQFVKA